MGQQNTQLPVEVQLKIENDALAAYKELYVRVLNLGDGFAMPKFNMITDPIEDVITPYAIKLHELQQKYDNILATESAFESKTENVWQSGFASGHDAAMEVMQKEIAELKRWKEEAKEVISPILDYGQSKEAGIQVGESVTKVVLERCKRFDAARTLLKRVAHRHEGGLLPDRLLYLEIKTFLDGTI